MGFLFFLPVYIGLHFLYDVVLSVSFHLSVALSSVSGVPWSSAAKGVRSVCIS